MDPTKVRAAVEALKTGDAEAAISILEDMIVAAAGGSEEAPPAEEPAEPPPEDALSETPEEPPAEEQTEEETAAHALMRLTGRDSVGAAVTVLSSLVRDVERQNKERATVELSARRELIARLVTLGVELPSTAWAGDPAKRTPVKRLSDEPLDDLRARVTALETARPTAVRPAKSAVKADVTKLSKAELAECKKRGIDPQDFAERKANAVRRSA